MRYCREAADDSGTYKKRPNRRAVRQAQAARLPSALLTGSRFRRTLGLSVPALFALPLLFLPLGAFLQYL